MTIQIGKYQFKLKNQVSKPYIYDIIRKKYVLLTPEEKVRQYFIHFLLKDMDYRRSFIKVENGLMLNGIYKRSDILIYNASFKPAMLVECKSENVKLNQAVLDQISRYNQDFKVGHLVVTNGISTFCFLLDKDSNTYRQTNSIPNFIDL